MGCTASQGAPAVQENGGGNNEGKMMFPLSMYQKSLIQETWEDVEKELVTFGVGIFYRLFKLKPELIAVFPEFGHLDNLEEIKKMTRLTGHPKKIVQAIREAIKSLDDAENFVNKLEALGQKHVDNSLRPDYLHALGHGFNSQIKEMLGDECTKDVSKAWSDFYNFICRLMKSGLAKKKKGGGDGNDVGWF